MKALTIALTVAVFATNSFAWYQSTQGRWLSRDPIGDQAFFNHHSESVGFIERIALLGQYYADNTYLFVHNRPLDTTDLFGLREVITTGAWYNFAGIAGAIGHHNNPSNLPPSDPSRMPSFNYIHYKLQCKNCEQVKTQPPVPSWCKDCQIIMYSAGSCDGKILGSADISIGTTWLAQLALGHFLSLDMAAEAALQNLTKNQLRFECTPCQGSRTSP